jgi:hypothetical protein
MKRYLAGLTAVLVLAAASATGTDSPIELPRKDGSRLTAHAVKASTCAEVQEFLKSRLFYIEKEIGVQSYQRNAWQAFSNAAQVAQGSIETACRERADFAGSEHLIDGASSIASDTLQLFDRAAKAFVDVLTPAQLQKFSDALWSFVRSELEWERSEIECCPAQQSIVVTFDFAAGALHANG